MLDNAMLWRQFAVAIDQLAAALRACPEVLWERPLWPDDPDQWVAAGFSKFWYQGYHALFWLDLYLTGAEEGFAPPPPFALVEMHAHETLPRVYTRAELLAEVERTCTHVVVMHRGELVAAGPLDQVVAADADDDSAADLESVFLGLIGAT